MTLTQELLSLLRSGIRQIGELSIQTIDSNDHYSLCHWRDVDLLSDDPSGLEPYWGPQRTRELGTYSQHGEYRFSKAQENLKRGWILFLDSVEDLRFALDQFYPASLGIFVASLRHTLEIENLRDKLERQTGMYRFARTISDAGAQRLVREVCGPAHQCARKILWQLDAATPLEPSEASHFNGFVRGANESRTIPLLCREACNHFVTECRRVAKEESAQGGI